MLRSQQGYRGNQGHLDLLGCREHWAIRGSRGGRGALGAGRHVGAKDQQGYRGYWDS